MLRVMASFGAVLMASCLCLTAGSERAEQLPSMIAYWSGFELGNPLVSLKDQPFGTVILTMAYFYSDTYTESNYNACGWSLNVAVKQCSSNTSSGTNCGVQSWNSPPPACCSRDITQPNSASCPGKDSCSLDCRQCNYDPEPTDCCFTPSGIDTRYLTLRHTLAEIKSGVSTLRSAGKKVMVSMFDQMNYPGGPGVTLDQVDPQRGAASLAAFVHDMGLDGVDFNYENIRCGSSAADCKWVQIIKNTRAQLPNSLISLTTYGIGGAIDVLTQVKDVIDFAQEDSYGGATSMFHDMKNVMGNGKVYFGIEADGPRTELSQVAGLAKDSKAEGAAGLFLWVANRDTNVSTSCLDPVNGGARDHPSMWAYTTAIQSNLESSEITIV